MPLDQPVLDELVRGDPGAEANLRTSLRPLLMGVAVNAGVDRATAEDIVETALLEFCTVRLKQMRRSDPETVRAYLVTTVMRRCWSWKKRRRRLRSIDDIPEAAADPRLNVEAALDRKRDLEKLQRCLGRLTVRSRKMIILRYAMAPLPGSATVAADQGSSAPDGGEVTSGGLTLAQVGAHFGVSAQHAGRVIKRAMRVLRRCLEAK